MYSMHGVIELLLKYMLQLGIECIFGMPGAHILPVCDSLYVETRGFVLS